MGVKKNVKSTFAALFLISLTFSVVISSTLAHLVMAQSENKTSLDGKNNTRRIINLVNNTITVIDKTTNETLSVTPYNAKAGNASTNGTMNNGSFPTNKENRTSNETLAEQFNNLGK